MGFLDHVLLGVRELPSAAERIRREWGWGTLPGGSPAPGIANAVVPLEPPVYLELVTVTDPAASAAAAGLAAAIEAGDRLFTWAIEPADSAAFDARAAALGIEPLHGGGDTGRWRLLGEVGPAHPFLIDYDLPRSRRVPGWQRDYARAAHDNAPGRVVRLELGGDEARVRRWVNGLDVPLSFAGGEPGLRAAVVATARGEVVVR